jgi:hypothetical protein
MAWGAPRPTFEPDIADVLRHRIESALGELTTDGVWVNKAVLHHVLTCEGLYLSERDAGFCWSAASVRGTLTHRAIEKMILHRHQPGEAARAAIERAPEREDTLGAFVAALDEEDRADLCRDVANSAADFQMQWPPIDARWCPRIEAKVGASICGDRVVLRGKYDLALGVPRGTEARVLIVDFKTGAPRLEHLDQIRLYALIETLRMGVPPFRIAVYSFEQAGYYYEDVTVDLLVRTADRVAEGITAIVALGGGRPPTLRPSAACRWCPARTSCPAAPEL